MHAVHLHTKKYDIPYSDRMDLAYLVGQAMLGAVGGLVIYVAANYYLGISEA